jgi:hypothetical protein
MGGATDYLRTFCRFRFCGSWLMPRNDRIDAIVRSSYDLETE